MSTQRIHLTPRLQAVADFVTKGSLFADIGTDHGYLPLYLLEQGAIASAIASDINAGPLDCAKQTASKYQIPLDLRLNSGLLGILPEEVNCVAIAGMGGITISQILQDWQSKHPAPWKGTFLLQPMSTQKELRLWLNQQGYTIHQERTIPEGETLYTVMKVTVGQDSPYHIGELLLGRQTPTNHDPHRDALLAYWQKKTEHILQKLQLSTETQERRLALETQLQYIDLCRKEWKQWHPL